MNKLVTLILIILVTAGCGNNQKAAKKTSSEAGSAKAPASGEIKNILFFGNSLTAGYGLEDPSEQSFPALIRDKIDSLKLPYKVINAGNSGETTAGGKSRIGWILRNKVDVFVLELGANDGLRGIPVKETSRNLQAIIDTVKIKYPQAKLVLLGMEVPPNMGGSYTASFRAIFRQIAEKNNMTFVPFLLDKVAGITKLNQKDGIHPTAEGAKIVAENVWKELEKIL